MKLLLSILQWLFVTILIVGCWWLFRTVTIPAPAPLTGGSTVLFGLALAFVWVEVLKWGSVKPFNCVKCLTGWFAFILAFIFHVPHFYLYLPLGVFVGAIFSAIQMRWL